jgi:hypothetical protein
MNPGFLKAANERSMSFLFWPYLHLRIPAPAVGCPLRGAGKMNKMPAARGPAEDRRAKSQVIPDGFILTIRSGGIKIVSLGMMAAPGSCQKRLGRILAENGKE